MAKTAELNKSTFLDPSLVKSAKISVIISILQYIVFALFDKNLAKKVPNHCKSIIFWA